VCNAKKPQVEAKVMVQQAAESVMKAYLDGISRQSVQLILGHHPCSIFGFEM